MDWTIAENEQTAIDGVERGDYYDAIILPDDFSNKFTTLFDGQLSKSIEDTDLMV